MTRRSEQGAVAVFALGVLAVVSILSGAWLRMVAAKLEAARLDGSELQAEWLADAGIQRALGWFAAPATAPEGIGMGQTGECPAPEDPGAVLRKRCRGVEGLPTFLIAGGARQFGGTIESPGVHIEWADAAAVLEPPASDLRHRFARPRSVRVDVRVFSPRSPDAVATLVSRATVDGASTSVRVELMEGPWRGLSKAVTAHNRGADAIPVRVHWGETAIHGDVDLTALLDRLPRRDPLAVITGSGYPSEPGRDPWAGLVASGTILGPPRDDDGFAPPFEHIRDRESVAPLGIWPHDALRAFAIRHGVYFATRGTGLLYPADGGPGLSPSVALAAHSGTGRLLFVDTLDGAPPCEDNLDTLDLAVDHVEAVAYIGAHLRLSPGVGRSINVDTPPAPNGADDRPLGPGITIDTVHYRGALIVAGELSVTGRVNLVGAVAALRGIRDAGAMEVWYDAALRRGYRQEFPPVMIKPGSRRAIVLDIP